MFVSASRATRSTSCARRPSSGTGVPADTYLTSSRPMLCAQAASERNAASSVRPSSGDEASPSSVSLASASASRAAVPACLRCSATTPIRSSTALAPSSPARPAGGRGAIAASSRSEEHTSELQSHVHLVCRLLLEKKKKNNYACTAFEKNKPKRIPTKNQRD